MNINKTKSMNCVLIHNQFILLVSFFDNIIFNACSRKMKTVDFMDKI